MSSTLAEVVRALDSARTARERLALACRAAVDLGADGATICRLPEGEDVLLPVAADDRESQWRSIRAEFADARWPLPAPLIERIRRGEVVSVEHAANLSPTSEADRFLQRTGIERFILAPIAGSGRVVGTLGVSRRADSRAELPSPHAVRVIAERLGEALEEIERPRPAPDDRFELMVRASLDAVVMMDVAGFITEFNPAAERMFGHTRAQAVGRRLSALLIPADRRAAHEAGVRRLAAGGLARMLDRRVELEALHASGRRLMVELTITRASTDAEPVFVGFLRDVSERYAAEREIAELQEDNRLILSSLGEGVVRIDLDGRVTFVNPKACELLGFSEAELMARRLHELVHHHRPDGTVYPRRDCPINLVVEDGQVRRRDDEVFWRADNTPFPVDYTSAPVREHGVVTGAVCVFSDITARRQRERETLEDLHWQTRLSRAMASEEIVIHSQPIVDLGTGRATHEELLVRLPGEAPDEVVPPAEFLPAAERSGLIVDLDRYMLRRAVAMISRGARVAVNISARSLADRQLTRLAERLLSGAGVASSNLIFEITETAAMADLSVARDFFERVERLGAAVALDDFGTGYGSLTYLRRLPVRYLKIDRSFVGRVAEDEGDRRVVSVIVHLARQFGQKTIAEGVESEQVAALLAQMGVDYAQGYHFGRPGPVRALSSLQA